MSDTTKNEYTSRIQTELDGQTVHAASGRRRATIYLVILFVVAAILLFSAVIFRNIMDDRAYDKHMETAQMSMLNGDYDSALSSLRKANAIAQTKDCAMLMAQCYEVQGNYEKAEEVLRTLDTTDSAVSSYITALDSSRIEAENADRVEVNGKSYPVTTASLVLDSSNLSNDNLPQIVKLYALTNLSIANNNISDISALSSLGGITTLNLSGNQISNLSPLTNLTNLKTLYLDNNPISDLTPLYSLSSLTNLSLKGISITESQLSALSQALPNCTINGATAQTETEVIYLGGVSFGADVTSIDLSYCGLTDISALSKCKNLTTINLQGNSISDLTPLMDIPTIVTLNISENMVSDVRPLMGLSSIKDLDVSDNQISSTASLGMMNGLQNLDLSNNPITNFSGLRKLKNLTVLNLSGCGLQNTDVGYFQLLTRLLSLNIENNPDFSGESFDELQTLLPTCNIAHSELVYERTLDGQSVDSNATQLILPNCGINDISALVQLSLLQYVDLSGNLISDLYYFRMTDSWQTMVYLDLSANQVTDVSPLANLVHLQTLNLSNNQITDVTPLYNLGELRTLTITGNPLSDEQIQNLEINLPNCEIIR